MGAELSGGKVAGQAIATVPFEAHVELLRLFLKDRETIVEGIEGVLNTQRAPSRYMQGGAFLARQFEDCFFVRVAGTANHLRGQLKEAHAAGGFRPRQVDYLHNDLIHPVEMMLRGVHCWQQTRWPGRSERMHYAHALFNLYVLRSLQFMSLHLWDEDPCRAGGRLTELQGVLDELWRSAPSYQPVFVRDARWLIPLALSLITDELAPYFEVVQQFTETLQESDVLQIQKPYVRMLGGHLTSQIRYYCTKDGVSINDPSVVGRTRTSNALDLALLVQGLVPVLTAYDRSLGDEDERMRLDLAGAFFQAISPDPELFLNRHDLLSAYSMIEHVLIAGDHEGRVAYSDQGRRHVGLLKEYGALVARLIQPLCQDLPRFRPVDGGYSSYGVLFGLPTNLIEHMALKAVQRDAETRFSLEDVFGDDAGAAKLAWVNGWRRLPHVPREVQRSFEFPHQFAEDIYERIQHEVRRYGSSEDSGTGRLYIGIEDLEIPEVPAEYVVSSDRQLAAAHKATFYDQPQLLRDRQEGHFLVSYPTPTGWIALKKNLLAEVLGAGRDVRVAGLPSDAAQVLRHMCSALLTGPPGIERP